MSTTLGFDIVRGADLEWQDRTNVDGWASRSAIYLRDTRNGLVLRLVEWPVDATEPVHRHPGTHATTVVKGRVVADGLELGPLGVILGYGEQPHGPLHFPIGAVLVSALQGDAGEHLHIQLTEDSVQTQPCAISNGDVAWRRARTGTHDEKVLVDDVLGRLRVSAARFPPGGGVQSHSHAALQAALVLEGSALIGGEHLEEGDLFSAAPHAPHGPVSFPDGALLLLWTLAPSEVG